MRKVILTLLLAVFIPNFSLAQDRDPFAPYIAPEIATEKEKAPVQRTYTSNTVELDKHPLKSYKLIGVIASNKKTLGVVRSVENRDYFVAVGDSIGKEGGVVEVLNIEKMGVVLNEKLVSIPVSNKIVEVDPNAKKTK